MNVLLLCHSALLELPLHDVRPAILGLCLAKVLVSFYEFVYLMHMSGGLLFCPYKNNWEFRSCEIVLSRA